MPRELASHYHEGYLHGVAARLGCLSKENPYPRETEEHLAWCIGFNAGLNEILTC